MLKHSVLLAASIASIFSLFASGALHAQPPASAAPKPSFAVSAIHPSDPNSGTRTTINFNNGNFQAENATLAMLIRIAYDLSDDQLSGGPSWLTSRKFHVAAKADAPLDASMKPEAAMAEKKRMLQELLADRFQLKLRHDTKDIPGYSLVVVKTGLKDVHTDDDADPKLTVGDGEMSATAITLDQVAYVLGQRILQSPVKNLTGLAGKYDLKLKWDPAQSRAAAAADSPAAASDAGPSIFVALQQQLGLKLESHKTSADSVVVESAQMPSEN